MLPKFATHLLQLKSHGTHHIRNVLQSTSSTSLPWSGLGSSSSSWGSSTGAGGAKFNAGSRFYAGYTGPGRVITQATSLPAADGSNSQVDDSEERNQALRSQPLVATNVSRLRRRRSSITPLSSRPHISADPSNTPQSSAIHSQVKHAFMAEERSSTNAPGEGGAEEGSKRTRRNSMSALHREPTTLSSEASGDLLETAVANAEHPISYPSAPSDDLPLQALGTESTIVGDPSRDVKSLESRDSVPSNAVDPQSSTSKSVGEADGVSNAPTGLTGRDLEQYNALKLARQSGSIPQVMQEIVKLRQSGDKHSVATYNMALAAVNAVRTKGMPIVVVLELYNEMLENDLAPDSTTYSHVIRALCDRDHDIHDTLASGLLPPKQRGPNPALGDFDASTAEHVRLLQGEENFASAMALFNSARALHASHFGVETYNVLLRSAGYRGDTEAAVRVYSHLEGRANVKPTMATYGHLISTYARARDIEAAQDIFNEFRQAAQSNGLDWARPERAARRVYMQVFNRMISAYFQCGESRGALALLEEMLGAESKENFGPGEIPAPSTSTFTEIIAGFCDGGDLESAVKWFERLLQSQATASTNDPYVASKVPLRPDREAWVVIAHHLAEAGELQTMAELLGLMISTAPVNSTPLQAADITQFIAANTDYLLSDNAIMERTEAMKLLRALQTILPRVAAVAKLSNQRIYAYEWDLIRSQIRLGEFSDGLAAMKTLVSRELQDINAAGMSQVADYLSHGLRRSMQQVAHEFVTRRGSASRPKLDEVASLVVSLRKAGIPTDIPLNSAVVRSHLEARVEGASSALDRMTWLTLRDAFVMLQSASASPDPMVQAEVAAYFPVSSPFPGIESFIEETKSIIAQPDIWTLSVDDVLPIHAVLTETRGRGVADSALGHLGAIGDETIRTVQSQLDDTVTLASPAESSDAALSSLLASESDLITSRTGSTAPASDVDTPSSVSSQLHRAKRAKSQPTRINFKLSSMIEAARHRLEDPLHFFQMIMNDARRNQFVTPSALSLVINALGRTHQLEKARELYAVAQTVLASLEDDKASQTRAWFVVEDAMVCAHAFASDMEMANLHRARMIEQGGAPSAEAYAVLIMTVNDFTDDCSVALGLYNEAISLGVLPNVFLYNNIISKLSKARKAEAALEIFQEMKKHGVRPTSVTYGALVGACCRVGDADTAMYLFSEMSAQANFRPKAPPFNTMIQFFVHTKPDRERALHYYNLMIASNVQASAHTHKLLMDAYGLIEPVDMNAVQIVFDQLVARKDLQVQGNHWASLITAWGCSCKDVERARTIFDSIPTHPTTLRSGQQLPDAQTWEAYINVLVTQHRFDLLGPTLDKLRQSGVHMTAYIANVVIRGYASAGQVEEARNVFESMQDPPEGMAASFNHLGISPSEPTPVATDAPVYREPSTYEAMVRAEMGVGERDRALSLLDRMEARHFPPAVEARIRGLVNQTIPSEWIPNNLDLHAWQTGTFGIDYNQLPASPVQHFAPLPADTAMYIEASA